MIDVVWRAVRKLPVQAWGLVGGVALLVLVYAMHARAVGNAYRQGKRDAAAGVVFDSLMLERAARRVAGAMAHTDTVWLRVKGARKKVDSAVALLPPDVAKVPEVKALVGAVAVLSTRVDSLLGAHAAERLAWVEKSKTDSAAIYALRVIATAKGDTVNALKKRPTWKKLVGVAAGVAAITLLIPRP